MRFKSFLFRYLLINQIIKIHLKNNNKMPIPIIKAALTALRYALRPINNNLMKHLKSYDKESIVYLFFEEFGQKTNRMEIKMNRIILGTKGLGDIKDIHESIAFAKGVEWFTEIFFFYGVLFLITWYELKKSIDASSSTKK